MQNQFSSSVCGDLNNLIGVSFLYQGRQLLLCCIFSSTAIIVFFYCSTILFCIAVLLLFSTFTFYSTRMYCFLCLVQEKSKKKSQNLWLEHQISEGNIVLPVKPTHHKIKKLKERMLFSLQEFKLYYLFFPIHK